MSESALIIFVKNPELGKVKTRLAEALGDEQALGIYQKLLTHTHQVAAQVKADRIVYYSDRIEINDVWADGFHKEVQSEGDLGDRLSAACETQIFNYYKICLIGSDCAELTSEIVNEAFEQLNKFDAVIGPANDGGYYLLAMKDDLPELFESMNWSTPEVYDETCKRMKSAGLTYHVLPELIDVDTIEDWELVKGFF